MTPLDEDGLASGVAVMSGDERVCAAGVADGAVVVGGGLHPHGLADGHGEDDEREPPEDRLLAVGCGPAPGTGGERVREHGCRIAPRARAAHAASPRLGGGDSRTPAEKEGCVAPFSQRAMRSSAAPIALLAWTAKRRSMPAE